MSCSRQSKVQTDWSVDFFLAAGSSAADRGQAEAKCWGQGRGQSFETETEATSASRTYNLWYQWYELVTTGHA